jgi:hypothetical protein
MMKRARVYITIIVYANTENEHTFLSASESAAARAQNIFMYFWVHRITNPRHIIYVNRFLLHDVDIHNDRL